jgi:hypothetical protein
MRKLFLILDKLTINKIHFCLQSHGDKDFYNLKVMTPQGKEDYISGNSLELIEERLIIIWGHLIGSTANVIKTPAPLSVPIPPPMPPPV